MAKGKRECSCLTKRNIISNCCHMLHVFDRTEEKEVGTEGKMLLLACDNGHLLGFALHGGEKVWGGGGIYLSKNN